MYDTAALGMGSTCTQRNSHGPQLQKQMFRILIKFAQNMLLLYSTAGLGTGRHKICAFVLLA